MQFFIFALLNDHRIGLPCGPGRAAPANNVSGNATCPGAPELFKYYVSGPGDRIDWYQKQVGIRPGEGIRARMQLLLNLALFVRRPRFFSRGRRPRTP
jgi:hypothetical protein